MYTRFSYPADGNKFSWPLCFAVIPQVLSSAKYFGTAYSYASLRPPEESVAVIVVTWKIFILSIFKKKNFVLGLIIDFNIFRFSF